MWRHINSEVLSLLELIKISIWMQVYLFGGHILEVRSLGKVVTLSLGKIGAKVNRLGSVIDSNLRK